MIQGRTFLFDFSSEEITFDDPGRMMKPNIKNKK
jgi:hypothetical protein